MFRNLKVVGLGAAAAHFSTVGSVLNPMIALEKIQTLRHPPLRDIISGFEGVVRPGEMLREFSFICMSSLHNLIMHQLS